MSTAVNAFLKALIREGGIPLEIKGRKSDGKGVIEVISRYDPYPLF